METYCIIRFFKGRGSEIIKEGLSLEEAQEHCNDPETSSSTAVGQDAVERTLSEGDWFDGYTKEA